jgi:hypothetical protein
MDRAKWDRWAQGYGIVAVALVIVTFFLPGSPPKIDDSPSTIASWYTENQDALLTNSFLSGLALVFLTFFFASLVYTLWNAEERRLAITTLAGAVLLGALGLLAVTIQTLLAYGLAAKMEAETVKFLWAFTIGPFGFNWAVAIIAAATGFATLRTRILPTWYAAASIVASVWFVISGATYASDGFFSPTGAFATIGFFAFLAWVLLTSGLLLTRTSPAEAPRPATAM